MPQAFKLSRPLKTHKGNVEEINLREPTAAQVFRFGFPFKFLTHPDNSTETVISGEVMQKYLVELSGLDAGTLGEIDPADLMDMWEWLGAKLRRADKEAEKNSEQPSAL